MDIPNTVMIAVVELKGTVEQKKDATLEERLLAAMREARHHWLITGEEDRFKAAVGAVFLLASDNEKARLSTEMRLLGGISAAITGVPVDMGTLLSDDFEPVGLLGLWRSTAG